MGLYDDLANMGQNTDSKETSTGNTIEEFEQYLQGQGYNLDELSKVLREDKTQLIVTGAGSGKTTAIILKALADLKTGKSVHKVTTKGMTTYVTDKIWVSTFLKSGAEELQRTLNAKKQEMGIVADTSNFKFSTIHAEFKHALTDMGVPTPIIPFEGALKVIREVSKDFGLGASKGYPTNAEIASIQTHISGARNRLDPTTYNHEDMEEVGLTTANLPYVIKMYRKKLQEYRVVDFDDLQDLLYQYAVNEETRNVNVTNFLANRYDKIILDEFQDVSEIQYEILKVYARGCKSVVAVGDDDQAIYAWRGSNINIITKRFKEDFNPVMNVLSVNYRCPSNILNPIAKSIVLNENRHDKSLKSFKEGGELFCYGYSSTVEMARSLQEQIIEDAKEGRTVAVLSRTNGALLPLSVLLDYQTKFNYTIRGSLYDLKRIKFKRYWGMAYMFTENGGTRLVDNLKMLAPGEPKYKLKNFANALKTEGETIFSFPFQALRSISIELAEYVRYMQQSDIQDEISALKATFEYLKADLVDSKGNLKSEENMSIIELLLMMIDESKSQTISDFLYEIDYRNSRLHGRAESTDLTIQLTTVHDFKGKEADSVYIWKDIDTMFPSERSAQSDFEEERRVHYIAGTRAKKRSTILTIMGHESPFIKEMEITPTRHIGTPSKGRLGYSEADEMIEGLNVTKLED